MGAESSALRGFTLQEPPWSLPSGLCIYPAALRDGRPASVFIYQPESSGTVHTAAQHLKTLRHPCLLRFLSCTVEIDGIHLITERVQPLEMILESLSADEICAGIYDILQALVFLHDTGHSAHNNVCLSSVFVSEDGHWKLGGMEMVSKLTEVAPEFAEFGVLPEGHGHARDAFAFGKMVESLLPYLTDQVSTDLVSRFQCTLNSTLLNPDPMCRPSLCSLLSHEFFRNDFLEVVNFLKCLTVKTEEEKNEFFKFLFNRVSGLSEELIISRLVPLLLNQLVFAEPAAVNSFLPHLLRPKKDTNGKGHSDCLLSPAIFQARVIPLLLKLFKVHEEHVRMVLLTHIDAYGGLFSKEDLKNEILPQVLLGLRDNNDSMVAMTLHSLAVLVSLLGPEVVIGGDRTRIFKSTTPSFAKTTDTTPDDSPVHMNHIMQINQPMKYNFANVLSKTSPTRTRLFNSNISRKDILNAKDSATSLSKAEKDFQSVLTLSVNGISNNPQMILCSQDRLSKSVNPTEEWPDWSESEELGNEKAIKLQMRPECIRMEAQHELNNPDEETFVDLESLNEGLNPALETICIKDSLSDTSLLVEESNNIRSSLTSGAVNSVSSCSNDCQDPPNQDEETSKTVIKTPYILLEKSLEKKMSTEFGLGEEFTIQVKKKSQDPELDWFADMVPEIKPFSTTLIFPDMTEQTVLDNLVTIPNKVDPGEENDLQSLAFSSKFAADEIAETEAEGWGGADLNWEDDESNW